jgi:GT2 family glycosyltransferase
MKKKHTLPKNNLQKEEYSALLNAVKNYEERIKEIESSTYWKMYLFLTKTKLILTSDSYLKGNNWRFIQRLFFLFSKPGLFLIAKFFKQLFSLVFGKVNTLIGFSKNDDVVNYESYKLKNFPRESDLESMAQNIANFKIQPHIQLFVVVNPSNFKHLNGFLNAIQNQIYKHFFVSFVVESPSDKMTYMLDKVVKDDFRYSIVNKQTKFELICEYALFTKLNCMLRDDCLYQFVNEINKQPNADFCYSDNDFFDATIPAQSINPYFKPDWSPHTILSRNYIGDLFVISKHLFETVPADSFSDFYGLVLNYTTQATVVTHVSKVLYHEHQEEVTIDSIHRNHVSLNNFLALKYNNAHARISEASFGCFEPVFSVANPLVSIIIPSKNKSDILDVCIQSIVSLSTYTNFEILIIDNGSDEKSFFSSVAQWEFNYPSKIRSYRMDIPFNYSVLNNRAVAHANGEYLLFLNNDTKLISDNLIEELLKIAQLENVGAVGPKLLYPNDTIQHAGIVLSLDEAGAHIYSGSHKDTAGYFNNTNCLTNYSAVTGACMMIKKERFLEVGGFDENLAVDCNDVELCCKLLTKGYSNVYLPWVKMYHHECLTRGNPIISSNSMAKQFVEKQYFKQKWGKLVTNDPFYNKNLTRVSKKYELKHS